MIDSWAFRLGERLDQSALDRLRSRLGLRPSGRLTDDWDELFGEVRRAVDGGWVQVDLWRDVDTSEWRIDVEMPVGMPEARVVRMLAEVREAVSSAGLTITSSLKRPTRPAA